ncbi:hypothetical protein [Rhizobium sp. TH135]|uniref:hypothetical protein n=1 Tax=Rhizobium sp. TH135 TaxID=2067451 RepID=UPI00117CA527|nr:hypothetical protein [Rhizobium sp. TH135]
MRRTDPKYESKSPVGTFPPLLSYLPKANILQGDGMSQRLKVKEMVMQMHERNLVLMNILRDIAENETSGHIATDATDEQIARHSADKALRRKDILGEISHILHQEDMARRVKA